MVISRRHPQWVFGLCALALVALSFLFFLFQYQVEHDMARGTSAHTVCFGSSLAVGSAILGYCMFLVTESYILSSILYFIPGAYVIVVILLSRLK